MEKEKETAETAETGKTQKDKPAAEKCMDMINLTLQQFNCSMKSDFIVSEHGVYPRIFVVENNTEKSGDSENLQE
jgi:hypothetical protein